MLARQPLFAGPALISGFASAAFPGGEFNIGKVELTWVYLGHAKAGATVVLVLFDNHQPVLDFYTTPEIWEQWVRAVPVFIGLTAADGLDSQGNLYALHSGEALGAGGFSWIATAVLAHDVAPGDTVTFKFEPDIPVYARKGEEERGASVEGVAPPHAKGEAEFYAWAAVWYGASSAFSGGPTQVPLGEPGERRDTLKGEGSIPTTWLAARNTSYLLVGDWTGSATPEGEPWDNLLNATSHGNHMVVDYLPGIPATHHSGTGTGTGHVAVVRVGLPVLPGDAAQIIGSSLITSAIESDETFGRGGGGLAQTGKRLVVTIAGHDWVADAGRLEGGEVVTGAIAPLFNDFNWPEGAMGGSLEALIAANWAPEVFKLVRQAWRDAARIERMPMPARAELRLAFRVTEHTLTRWRIYGDEGEDAYAATYWVLGAGGEPQEGDVYVAGVLARAGVVLECSAAEAAVGVEFVLREDLTDGLGEAGKEKAAEWRNPLGEAPIGLYPKDTSRFHTLGFTWQATANLFLPPPEEEYPGGPDGMGLIVETPIASLATVKKTVTETKEAEEAREKAERERAEKETKEREEKRAEERAKEKEELERLEKQREEEEARRKEREEKGEPESDEEKKRRERRELEERKIREERELREQLEAEEREEGGGGEGTGGVVAVGEDVTSGVVSRNRNPR